MKNKLIALLLCVTVSCTLLGGCQSSLGNAQNDSSGSSSNVETGAETADGSQSETTRDNNAITGQVTAIDGNTITLALGERAARPDGDSTPPGNGEKPSEPTSGDAVQTEDSDGTGGTPPSGDNGGTPPSGNGGGPGGLTLTGEEKSITIDESTTITKDSMGQSSDATIDDITDGTILTVIMDGETVVSVTISDFGGGNGGGRGGKMNDVTEESTDLNGSNTVDGTEETSDGDTVSSNTANENTILVKNEGSFTLDNETGPTEEVPPKIS